MGFSAKATTKDVACFRRRRPCTPPRFSSTLQHIQPLSKMLRGLGLDRVSKGAVAFAADADRRSPAKELREDMIVGVTGAKVAIRAVHDVFVINGLTSYDRMAPFPGAWLPPGLRAYPNDAFAWGHSTDAVRGVNSHWCRELDRHTRVRPVNWRWRHRAGIPWMGSGRQLPVRTRSA